MESWEWVVFRTHFVPSSFWQFHSEIVLSITSINSAQVLCVMFASFKFITSAPAVPVQLCKQTKQYLYSFISNEFPRRQTIKKPRRKGNGVIAYHCSVSLTLLARPAVCVLAMWMCQHQSRGPCEKLNVKNSSLSSHRRFLFLFWGFWFECAVIYLENDFRAPVYCTHWRCDARGNENLNRMQPTGTRLQNTHAAVNRW